MSAVMLDYAPPLEEDQIRILVILPVEAIDARIECSLERTSLDSPCEYTCLSYSCSDRDDGVVEFCETIFCDGVEIRVTKGAYHALRRIRQLGGYHVWVDAICIDQRNDTERSQQVSVMAKIYTAARTVFVWVGEESDQEDGRHAMTCFAGLGSLSHLNNEWTAKPPKEDDAHGLQGPLAWSWLVGRWCLARSDGHFQLFQTGSTHRQYQEGQPAPPPPPFTFPALLRQYGDDLKRVRQPLLNYVLAFLRRRWFGRKWVLQETHRARSISLHCGNMSLDFVTFQDGIELLNDHTNNLWIADSSWDFASVYRARHVADLRTWGPYTRGDLRGKRRIGETPPDVMYRFGDFDCSDDRDRVLALLSFFECPTISPDYSLTVEETYVAFATSLLENGHIGKTLWQAAIRKVEEPADVRAIPSWVPDWRNKTSISMDLWPTDSEARYTFGPALCDAEYRNNSDGSLSLQAWTVTFSSPGGQPFEFERCPCGSVERAGLLKGCIYASMSDWGLVKDHVGITHGDVRAGDMMLALWRMRKSDADFIVVRSVCSDAASCRIVGWCWVKYDTPYQISLQPVNLKIV